MIYPHCLIQRCIGFFICDLFKQARIYDYFARVKGDLLNPSSEQNLEEASLLIDLDVSVLKSLGYMTAAFDGLFCLLLYHIAYC